MRLQMFRRDAGAGVGDHRFDVAIDQRGNAQASAAGHRFLGIQKQIQKHLLQFAGVAVNRRQVRRSGPSSTTICAVLNWCSSSDSVSRMTWFRLVSRNSVVEVREKFSRPLAISEARKLCCVIFSSTGAEPRIAAQLLGEHLRVGGDDGQRRIDLVRHAGGQQADGAELVGLRELRFERDALGDVIDKDDAAHGSRNRARAAARWRC